MFTVLTEAGAVSTTTVAPGNTTGASADEDGLGNFAIIVASGVVVLLALCTALCCGSTFGCSCTTRNSGFCCCTVHKDNRGSIFEDQSVVRG